MSIKNKEARRAKIKRRIRAKVTGTAERPRLLVFRSLKHIYLQIVDDTSGTVLAAASTKTAALQADLKGLPGVGRATVVGKFLGAKAIEAGVTAVVFDRGGYLYHGQVKAAADGARDGGLQF
jgi:large subunit ribosomal protein L18